MATLSRSRPGLHAATLLVWALAAASAAYWGLRWGGDPSSTGPAAVAATAAAPPDPQAVARVLGAAQAPAAAPQASLASRFALQGVVAWPSGGGSALIAVDGKPARPYRVGGAVDDGLVLQSVAARQAVLADADGRRVVTLDMPALQK